MASLTEIERAQLRRTKPVTPPPRQWPRRPVSEYLAFAKFASCFAPGAKGKPIEGGSHWKL